MLFASSKFLLYKPEQERETCLSIFMNIPRRKSEVVQTFSFTRQFKILINPLERCVAKLFGIKQRIYVIWICKTNYERTIKHQTLQLNFSVNLHTWIFC